MNSPLLKLNSGDFMRGAATAVFAAVVAALYGIVYQEGFDLFSADWLSIGKLITNAAIYSFMGYIGKNLMTADNGKIFGKI
jgi:hypothetical protein